MLNEQLFLKSAVSIHKTTLYEKVFCVANLLMLAYFIIRPLLENATLILGIWVSATLLLFLFSIRQKLNLIEWFFLLVPCAILTFSLLTQEHALTKEHLISTFLYLNFLLNVMICVKITPTKFTFNTIFYIFIATALLFSWYTFTPVAHRWTVEGMAWSNLYYVFNLDNSNFAGMCLFTIFCVLLINLPYRKFKIPILLLLAYTLYMIYGTNCRSALFSAIAVFVGSFFFTKKSIPSFILNACTLVPIVMLIAYLYMYYQIGYDDFMLFNKNFFSGRQNVFVEFLRPIQTPIHVLFGNFAQNGLHNAHNAPLAIFSSLGIVGLTSFYALFIYEMTVYQKKEKTSIRQLALFSILGVFLISSAEASFFLGGFPGIVLVIDIILLGNYTAPMQ